MTPLRQHPRPGIRPLKTGLPFFGLAALLLASGQSLVAQVAYVPPPPSTWQSSPVLTKFMTELRAPGQIPVGLPDGIRTYPGSTVVSDHYTIDINQYMDKLHPALPATTLWGYHPTKTLGGFPQAHLGGILIAQRGRPTQITFRNNLPAKHILPVDSSIQGADPTVTENRTATHLHGGAVPWFSDGGPFGFWDANGHKGINFINNAVLNPGAAGREAEYYYPNDASARLMWYHDHSMGITRLNAYAGIASAYIIRDNFEAALVRDFGLPGFVENGGRELPLVFQDKIFQNGQGPSDPKALPFPGSAQGKGNLWYPYEYDLARWDRDPSAPNPLPPTSVVAEAFGDTMLVNGAAFPKATVDPRRYRFRVLNACQARVLNLQLYEDNGHGQPNFKKPGPHWTVIGTEGGFLARPVNVPSAPLTTFVDPLAGRYVDPAAPGGSLIVATGERFDLVVDFNGKAGKKYILYNDAPAPYPNGAFTNDYPNAAGIGDTSVLMRFEVKADSKAIPNDTPWLLTPFMPMAGNPDAKIDPPLAGHLAAMPTPFLTWLTATTAPLPIPTRKGVTVRHLTLNEGFDASGRLIQMLGTNVAPKAGDFSRPYFDPADLPLSEATETPAAGATEVWEIANLTGDTHPIHIHLANAQILSRRVFDTVAYANTAAGSPAVPTYYPTIPARGPEATELGWKETIKMHPGEVTTVIMQFNLPKVPFKIPVSPRTGGHEYVWHCHILEHEEHDMMRTLVVQ
jgi:spore coat protein A